jgi:putative hydrolase of the HAD superfamily
MAGENAVIVDWGGVLTTPVNDSFESWAQREDVPIESLRRVFRCMHDTPKSALHRVEIGEIDGPTFERMLAAKVSEETGRAVRPSGLLKGLFSGLEWNREILDLLDRVRSRGWRVAVLSNSWGLPYDRDFLATVAQEVFLSDEIRLRKPDSRAYLHVAEAMSIEPTNCVFVDDLRRNVAGAEAVGMHGHRYEPGSAAGILRLVGAIETG